METRRPGSESAFRRFVSQSRGATALEMAIVLPAFLMLVFGIEEFGRLFWLQSSLQYAVEQAARCAAVNTTLCGTAGAITAYAADNVFGASVPSADFTSSTPACGHEISVSYEFVFLMPAFFSPSVTLGAQSCHP